MVTWKNGKKYVQMSIFSGIESYTLVELDMFSSTACFSV